jgi:hypothetical protein
LLGVAPSPSAPHVAYDRLVATFSPS